MNKRLRSRKKDERKKRGDLQMNKRLTDFEETKEMVVEHHRAMHRKPDRFSVDPEQDSMLDTFLKK